jgi:hypothetical protein
MSAEPTTRSDPELVDELSAWLVGGGILTVALFPLALPFLLLTLAAMLPFVVVPLIGGLVAGLIALPVGLLIRRALRARPDWMPIASNPT